MTATRDPATHPAVYVRGAGVVGLMGNGAATVLEALRGPSPAAESARVAGAPRTAPFEPAGLPGGIGRRLGRQPALVLGAVLDALAGRRPPDDTALVLASAHGAVSETIDFLSGAAVHGAAASSPLLFANSLHNAMSGVVGRVLDLRGPAIVVSNGGASFESALLAGVALLRGGHARHAIVGGSDALHPVFARGLRVLGLVADTDAPADPASGRTARGYPYGEGGAALLLELGEPGGPGVVVEDVALGAACRLPDHAIERVQWLATGERRSVLRHRAEWERIAAARAARRGSAAPPEATFPAERHGVFGSLSAVAVAVEASRRLRLGAPPPGSAVFLQVAQGTAPATVVVGGHGPG